MTGLHAIPPRGLREARSPLFDGRFGRMFRQLRPAQFGTDESSNLAALGRLAQAMEGGPDRPKDGPDGEESGIPALYTYFGQFIDHDLTFDPASSLMTANDPDALVDFRTPALDLDNLYGRGPGDQPYMYDGPRRLQLGVPITGSGVPDAPDLPRFKGRALIGDPRNDENTIVSQFQGLMIRFHNRLCDENGTFDLEHIQKLVRFHYQYVVLHDFLPRIIAPAVLAELKSGNVYDRRKLRFYHWKNAPFIPVEFAVAAYRLGHSMIRPGYRLNDSLILPIFPTDTDPVGLTGFKDMSQGWAIDWGRFIDIEKRDYDGTAAVQQRRLQMAYRLDPSLVAPLTKLPNTVASDPPPSLALRNLERGWRLGLPTGQAVARAMNIMPLEDKDIIIAKALDKPDPTDPKSQPRSIVEAAGKEYAHNCPLWTYILAEAAHHASPIEAPVNGSVTINTPQLGPVGGRIVAEVFLGMLYGDGMSLLSLDPSWTPRTGPDFRLRDIVNYALGKGQPLG